MLGNFSAWSQSTPVSVSKPGGALDWIPDLNTPKSREDGIFHTLPSLQGIQPVSAPTHAPYASWWELPPELLSWICSPCEEPIWIWFGLSPGCQGCQRPERGWRKGGSAQVPFAGAARNRGNLISGRFGRQHLTGRRRHCRGFSNQAVKRWKGCLDTNSSSWSADGNALFPSLSSLSPLPHSFPIPLLLFCLFNPSFVWVTPFPSHSRYQYTILRYSTGFISFLIWFNFFLIWLNFIPNHPFLREFSLQLPREEHDALYGKLRACNPPLELDTEIPVWSWTWMLTNSSRGVQQLFIKWVTCSFGRQEGMSPSNKQNSKA